MLGNKAASISFANFNEISFYSTLLITGGQVSYMGGFRQVYIGLHRFRLVYIGGLQRFLQVVYPND